MFTLLLHHIKALDRMSLKLAVLPQDAQAASDHQGFGLASVESKRHDTDIHRATAAKYEMHIVVVEADKANGVEAESISHMPNSGSEITVIRKRTEENRGSKS